MSARRSQWYPLAALWRGHYALATRYVFLCLPAPIVAATALVLLETSFAWGPGSGVPPMIQPRRLHDAVTAQAAFGGAALLLGAATLGLLALATRWSSIPASKDDLATRLLTWFLRLVILWWWLFVMLIAMLLLDARPVQRFGPLDFEPPADTRWLERDLALRGITLPGHHEIILYESWSTGASGRNYVIRVDPLGGLISGSRPYDQDWSPGPHSSMALSPPIHWICAQQITGFPTFGLDTPDRRLAARAVCDHLKPPPLRQGFRHLPVQWPHWEKQSESRIHDRDIVDWGDKAVIAFPDLSLVWFHDGWP
ncbi:MAG: hypothetical protein RID91_17885 [Azospirillaceae bacterium]